VNLDHNLNSVYYPNPLNLDRNLNSACKPNPLNLNLNQLRVHLNLDVNLNLLHLNLSHYPADLKQFLPKSYNCKNSQWSMKLHLHLAILMKKVM
jgi:hypothetical protein